MGTKVIVVMPAYNAASTLEKTYRDIPKEWVDEIILGDDGSTDETVRIAKSLGLVVLKHKRNIGYGGNQKTCYAEALRRDADTVVMIHPDYQYDAAKIPQIVKPLMDGKADCVFGSRILAGRAREGGMPLYKYIANRFLTFWENMVMGFGLSEYHTGLRAYSRKVLETVPWRGFSNGFLFDTEIIVEMKIHGFRIKEIPVETRYFSEASQIGFFRGCAYGAGTLFLLVKYLLRR